MEAYLSRFLIFMYNRLGAMRENDLIPGSKLGDMELNHGDPDHVVWHP